VACLDISWFKDGILETLPGLDGGFSSKKRSMEVFYVFRIAILWRFLSLNYGVIMLDSDVAVFQNLFSLGFHTHYDFVYAVDLANCGGFFHPLKAVHPPLCATPIPPYFAQPHAAHVFEAALFGFLNYPKSNNMLIPLCLPLQKLQKIDMETKEGLTVFTSNATAKFSETFRVAAIPCSVSRSGCNDRDGWFPLGFCYANNPPISMISYHANCKRTFFEREAALNRSGGWLLRNN
jgi:hypothetical protein